MQIHYEISETDFLNAQNLGIKHSPVRYVRWTRLFFPIFGIGGLVFIIHAVWQQGLSIQVVPALIFPVLFLCMPLLNRRAQKKVYAKNTSMHGQLSLEANDEGLHFSGGTFNSTVSWSIFSGFCEDSRSFVLYQNSGVVNIVPKRRLSSEQVIEFGDLCRRHLKARN